MSNVTAPFRPPGARAFREWVRGHNERDLPSPVLTPQLAMKWWIDELSIQMELATGRTRIPAGSFRRRVRDELPAARELFADNGWLADPRAYHQDPPELTEVRTSSARAGTLAYTHLRFDSKFEPWPDEPGRERWVDYRPVQTGHAWMLRHEGAPRPWIVLVNGYRTGEPATDFATFRAARLHHHHGLNVIGVVLPLHGPRAVGPNGGRVLYAGAMNTVFTIAQGAWDIRRVLSWIRNEHDAERIGITGISLGGYLAAMVSALDDDLAAVIAGVPEADLARGMRRQIDPLLPPFYEQWGLSWESFDQVMKVISPMSLPCLVPHDRRFIYAGLVDRWVRPGNVKDLWEHWERPEILWYEGSHLSFPFEPSVHRFVDNAVKVSFDLPR